MTPDRTSLFFKDRFFEKKKKSKNENKIRVLQGRKTEFQHEPKLYLLVGRVYMYSTVQDG